jgi:hypothetical protein
LRKGREREGRDVFRYFSHENGQPLMAREGIEPPTRGFSGREADRRDAKRPAPTRRIRDETAAGRYLPKPARRQVPTEVPTVARGWSATFYNARLSASCAGLVDP